MSVPRLTAEQRAAALARAAEARVERARVKTAIRDGAISVSDVLALASRDEAIARMRVTDLLTALPGVGPVRASELMERARIAPSRRLRGLGEHQAAFLVEALG